MKHLIMALLVGLSLSANATTIRPASIVSFNLADQTIKHSGRTDSSGCHNDTKKGTRHCH